MFEADAETIKKLIVDTKRVLLSENNNALRLWLICVYEALENQNKTVLFDGKEFELGDLEFVSSRSTITKLFNYNLEASHLEEKEVYLLMEQLEFRGYICLLDEDTHFIVTL